ncbi:MT-A70 family [Aspergillus novofumigatus IBT 16806]|uniref:MT-A70 family n=1 Tax=Aspergillus novofumigatus (strain IBT 16806) TaxID=1392255 RepID=A0A2I1CLI0_ASPN1|nr:MT-A70 family [Aspergillus novofumigatus IBT 16806]PKX98487.1 MT-A70 family [Aspergillus novofumigatus IBT 16806]
MMTQHSILYQNAGKTIFLIDIPTSIASAQELSPVQLGATLCNHYPAGNGIDNHRKRLLLSSEPLDKPYAVSTEPKSAAAKARVLSRIPASEQAYQTEIIDPLVRVALQEISRAHSDSADWCRERKVREEETQLKRKRDGAWSRTSSCEDGCLADDALGVSAPTSPPVILSPGLNKFGSWPELCNVVVRNTSSAQALLGVRCKVEAESEHSEVTPANRHVFLVPPLSTFLLCSLPLSAEDEASQGPIPGLSPDLKFNLILLDPPWSNRSVRRSGHYQTQSYYDVDLLSKRIGDILKIHLSDNPECVSVAAIWITNAPRARRAAYDAIKGAGLSVQEEWVWIKTTTKGEPTTPLDGLWRKPYEILVIGRRMDRPSDTVHAITRRVIAGVPDVHSRKPNLKEVFEQVFFTRSGSGPTTGDACMAYSALEVFARNLTAGWWACGNEALKFNSEDWWVAA